MGELLRLALDSIAYLWPFRLVKTGQLGGYYICGKYWRTVTPGWPYPVIPWFMQVECFPVIPAKFKTPRLDLTLRDGTAVSCVVSATGQVVDFNLAINTIDSYTETVIETTEAVTARVLIGKEKEDLTAGNLERLAQEINRRIHKQTRQYGVRVSQTVFTTFVINPRIYRLMQDQQMGGMW